jgi:hypothetical protein
VNIEIYEKIIGPIWIRVVNKEMKLPEALEEAFEAGRVYEGTNRPEDERA